MDLINDIFNLVMKYANNYHSIIVCKKWYDIIIKNCVICSTCKKIVKMYETDLWTSDNDIEDMLYIKKGNIYQRDNDRTFIIPTSYDHSLDYKNDDGDVSNKCNNITRAIDTICHGHYEDIEQYRFTKQMLSVNYNYLRNIERQTTGVCLFAIRVNKNAVLHIKNFNQEIYLHYIDFYHPEIYVNMEHNLDEKVEFAKQLIEKLYIEKITWKSEWIKYIHNQTEKIQLEVVSNYWYAIKYIINPSEAVCMQALVDDERVMEYVNTSNFTTDDYLKVIKINWRALEYVPDKFLSFEMYLECVKQGYPINRVPGEYITEELCLIAINGKSSNALEHIPEEYITEEMCLKAITRDPRVFRYVPKKYITEEMCLNVVKAYSYIISQIENPTYEMSLIASLDLSRYSFRDIPENHRTDEVCLNFMKRDVKCFKYIDNPSINICVYAAKHHSRYFSYIKKEPEEILLEVLKVNGACLEYIKHQTKAMCIEAINQNPKNLQYVNCEAEELFWHAIKNDINNLKYISKPTEEMILYVLERGNN